MSASDASGRDRRARWGLVATLLAAALILAGMPAVVSILAVRPYLGLTYEQSSAGTAVVRTVDPSSSAAGAGLQPGDQLQRIGVVAPNAALADRAAKVFDLDVLNRYFAGDTVTVALTRSGEPQSYPMVLTRPPTSLLTTHTLVYLVFWAIAALLLWARYRDPVVRLLVYTILALTAGNFFRPITDLPLDTTRGMLLQQLCAIGRFLGPALVVHFGLAFPRPVLPQATVRRIRALGYGIPFALFLVEEYVIWRGARSSAAPYLIYDGVLATIRYWDIRFFVFLGSFIACGVLLLRAQKKLTPGRERAQVKWVLWSVLFAALADTIIVIIALYGVGRYSDYLASPYRNLLYLTIAAGLLIAILRYDLFDIDRVIRISAVYFATTALMFLFFTGCENVVSDVLERQLDVGSSTVATLISAVFAAALFVPVRTVLDRAITRLLRLPPRPGAGAVNTGQTSKRV